MIRVLVTLLGVSLIWGQSWAPLVASYAQGASTGNLVGSTAAFPSTGTFLCHPYWTADPTTTGYSILFDNRNGGVTDLVTMTFDGSTDSWVIGWLSSGVDYRLTIASAVPAQNAWQPIAYTWNDTANTQKVYLAGTAIATSTAAFSTNGAATGARQFGNDATFNGRVSTFKLAACALWDAELLDADLVTLTSTAFCENNPADYNVGDRLNYWPLTSGDLTDPWGSDTLTNGDMTADVAHPTITSSACGGGGRRFIIGGGVVG